MTTVILGVIALGTLLNSLAAAGSEESPVRVRCTVTWEERTESDVSSAGTSRQNGAPVRSFLQWGAISKGQKEEDTSEWEKGDEARDLGEEILEIFHISADDEPLPSLMTVNFNGDIVETRSKIFNDHTIEALRGHLPLRVQVAPVWELLYSTAVNGMSFNTFIQRTGRRSPTLLFVKDLKNFVFGAFCSAAWECRPRFFGTGESFVFKWTPSEHRGEGGGQGGGEGRGGRGRGGGGGEEVGGHKCESAVSERGSQEAGSREGGGEVRGEDEKGRASGNGVCQWAGGGGGRTGGGGTLSKYGWSQKNDMFQSMRWGEGIVIGAGNNNAIRLNPDFSNGCSGASATFDSPCLASAQDFECLYVEVWGFVSSVRNGALSPLWGSAMLSLSPGYLLEPLK
jgi:hypothetical protein